MIDCYCHSGKPYSQCCQRYHQGEKAATPLALMRSRYSAFVLGLGEYLWKTHHPDYRTGLSIDQLSQQDTDWKKLEILWHGISPDQSFGIVEFKAWYQQGQQLQLVHERSQFIQFNQQWVYTDGEISPTAISRNAPCPCGSGKKFKQCCLKNSVLTA